MEMASSLDITYENVSHMLVEYLPEFAERYQSELKWWGNRKPGPHVVYGDILNPYIDQLLRSGDEPRLRRLFDFIEVLAGSPDLRIQELVAVTVCEFLGDDPERLKASKRFMGPHTVKRSSEVERFWG